MQEVACRRCRFRVDDGVDAAQGAAEASTAAMSMPCRRRGMRVRAGAQCRLRRRGRRTVLRRGFAGVVFFFEHLIVGRS